VKQAVFNALVKSFLNTIESSVFKTRSNVELHRACKLLKHSETRTHIPSRRCNLSFCSQYSTFRHCIVGNALILFALHNVRTFHLQPPTKRLFRCSAVTDLCVGLIKQPLFAIILLQAVTRINLNIFVFIEGVEHSTSYILCRVSVFTTTAIS